MAIVQTPAAAAAAAKRITRPLYLVEIVWPAAPISRLCTGGDVAWRGTAWSGLARVEVSGLGAGKAGRLVLGNVDGAFGTLAAGDVADAPVRIWEGHADALGDDDPRFAFEGVIDSVEITDDAVSLGLVAEGTRTQFAPRRVIGPESGFNVLLPAGTRMTFGGRTIVLER